MRVRYPHDEILTTITTRNLNRGLSFDSEMVPFCGGTYRVMDRVEKFIDEKTGRIKTLKTPAVILQDVTCGFKFQQVPDVLPTEHLGLVAGNLVGARGRAAEAWRSRDA